MKEFDYYIFIDYSENLIGYLILDNPKMKEISPKISKFSHYRRLKHKSAYIHSIKKVIEKSELIKCFLKWKIRTLQNTPEIYTDLTEFLKSSNNCCIFISIDDKQYQNFERFIELIDGEDNKIVKESELKKGSLVYQVSLVLDTLLNIERLKKENE
jgi:hypothetical protein